MSMLALSVHDLFDRPGLLFAWVVLISFTATALWELRRPLFGATDQLNRRWSANFGLFVVNHAAFYLFGPLLTVASAGYASLMGAGLRIADGAPLWLQWAVALVGLDFVRWAAHRALHRSAWLWQLHQVHHSDGEFDVSVGARFHPLEALLYALLSAALVLGLGLSARVVVAVELLFIAHNFFCHANAALPARAEALLRKLIITPDLHRVHHSIDHRDSQTNFGTVFSFWDPLFGCYRALPAVAIGGLRFGLLALPAEAPLGLWQLLCLPLRRLDSSSPLSD